MFGDRQTLNGTVTLVGQTEANAAVVLVQTGATTTADSNGRFQFQGVSLLVGDNSFSVTATDVAGNSSTATTIIKRYSPPTDIALDSNWVAENSARGTVIGQLSTADLDSGDSSLIP